MKLSLILASFLSVSWMLSGSALAQQPLLKLPFSSTSTFSHTCIWGNHSKPASNSVSTRFDLEFETSTSGEPEAVLAAASGIAFGYGGCTFGQRSCKSGLGNHVKIWHGGRTRDNRSVFTIYAHLEDINPAILDTGTSGLWVPQGFVLGHPGSTGNACGEPRGTCKTRDDHIHFGVHIGNPRSVAPGTSIFIEALEARDATFTSDPRYYYFYGDQFICGRPGGHIYQSTNVLTTEGAIPNRPPIAEAGPDQTINLTVPATQALQLYGGDSYDPDRDEITFAWRLVSSPDGSHPKLSQTRVADPVLRGLSKAGTYVTELEVSDDRGGKATDQVIITVTDISPRQEWAFDNGVSEGGVVGVCDEEFPSPPCGFAVKFITKHPVQILAIKFFGTQNGSRISHFGAFILNDKLDSLFSTDLDTEISFDGKWILVDVVPPVMVQSSFYLGVDTRGSSPHAQDYGALSADLGPNRKHSFDISDKQLIEQAFVHSNYMIRAIVQLLASSTADKMLMGADAFLSHPKMRSYVRSFSPELPNGISDFRVEIFDLAGRRVFLADTLTGNLIWQGQDLEGRPIANGVYLYVLTYTDRDGTSFRSAIKKLLVWR